MENNNSLKVEYKQHKNSKLPQIGAFLIGFGVIATIIETYYQLGQGCCIPIPIYGPILVISGVLLQIIWFMSWLLSKIGGALKRFFFP